jgi:hypothetical protein
MFTINGKTIPLSSNDTLDSLRGKIAASLGTLPPLLDVPENIADGGNYTIPDPIFFEDGDTIKIRKIDDEPIKWDEISMVNFDPVFLRKLYIITKVQSTLNDFGVGLSSDQVIGFAFLDLQTELGDVDENVWFRRTDTIKEFKTMIEENLKNTKKQIKTIDVWGRVQTTFESTPFGLNKINHQTEIPNVGNKNELMVFDSIKLNNIVVACFYQEMVKFNPDYKSLIDDYLNQDKILSKKIKASDIIRIMIQIRDSKVSAFNIPNSRTKYKMINIFVREEAITLTIETLINEPNAVGAGGRPTNNLKDLVKNILTDMGESSTYPQRQEKEFYYGSYSASVNIPLIILKDLITNDHSLYNISYINESALINTRKTNLNIFLKVGSNLVGVRSNDIGVSLFERPGTVGTFVRLKKIHGGPDLKTRINNYTILVNKILQYTLGKVDVISNFYQQYINLKIDRTLFEGQGNKEKDNLLKLQAPEIFIPNYTRLCNKPPMVVEDQEKMNDDADTVLKFPIYGESEPKYYSCPYPDYKYPGLRENTKLANRDIYPFVPCCYQRPQKKSKNYKMYYNQEVYEQRINAGEIGKTLKILSPERLGALPPKIDKLLSYTTNNKFYRYGIPLSSSSCVNILNKVTDRQESDITVRSELAKRAELCKGEFNSLSVKEIAKKVMDPTTYINPRYFKGALEDYYQLSFILFSLTEDDFSVYPNRFVRFICPLKKRVILMIEHEQQEHVELIVDEETSTYVNKQGKKPIFTFEKGDAQVKKIFALFKERFNHAVYDIDNKNFINLLTTNNPSESGLNIFQTYPWETISVNGKILKVVKPLNQYIDNYGQTRLVEFEFENISFVGQFPPLPCLKLPIKSLDYFISVNGKLQSQVENSLKTKFSWLDLYQTKLNTAKGYSSPYKSFKKMKRMAEYILWAACHFYSVFSLGTGGSVDEWISQHTQVVENFKYSKVAIKPIFNSAELMVNNKFIFNSLEFQNRIRFNLSLISPINLKIYSTNIYHFFFNDIANFNVVYPAQLALTKHDYFQRTRTPYILNILTTQNVQYIRSNTLYYIKDLFGYKFVDSDNTLCLFLPSLEKLTENASQFLGQKIVLDETIMNVTVFDQNTLQQYSVGHKEPSIDVIVININGYWFYGLILPKLM